MPEVTLQLGFLLQHLAEGTCLGELLFVPELMALSGSADHAVTSLRNLLPKMLVDESAPGLSQRQAPVEVMVKSVAVHLDSPREKTVWRGPAKLVFRAVTWTRSDGGHLAYVPRLKVAAMGEDANVLDQQLEKEIRFALQRQRAAESLERLVSLQRVEKMTLQHEEIVITTKSPKLRAQELARQQVQEKPVLPEVATDLTKLAFAPAIGRHELTAQLADSLIGRASRSVLLVGPSGVGKTAIVHDLIQHREKWGLADRPFWGTSGSRLIAGALGFGMWQERCHKMCREAAGTRAVIYFGNLIELMEIGKSETNSISIAGFLRSYLARGDLIAITECTPEQLAMLERTDPHLLSAFRVMRIEEPSREVGRKILEHVAGEPLGDQSPKLTDTGLAVLERLHRRYATYSGFPGRPIRFVRNLRKDATSTLGPAEVTTAFSRETGLPLFMLDDAVALNLAATREFFAENVIAQPMAADLVTDLLATLKAGLNRPRRPIASFLFIGPTGVGKTEMAKALAQYIFSDRARLTRFDMSEYGTPDAVERLVGSFGRQEGALTAKIRQQPFSVVLFDEVEKAHGDFFDLMLQVLGEGRLTDSSGRLADFTNSIIIMTSNLGAQSFGRPGFGIRQSAGENAAQHFTEEVRAFLRPELFNRIDRIVPFLPLNSAAIQQIARRELQLLRKRDGLRLRKIEMELDNASAEYLAAKGFDAAYGARPLKRAIERELLVPLSEAVNAYPDELPLCAKISSSPSGLTVEVRAQEQEHGALTARLQPALRPALLRRKLQRLQKSAAWMGAQNDRYRLDRQIKREEDKRPNHPMLPLWRQRLKRMDTPLTEIAALLSEVPAIEDEVLGYFYETGLSEDDVWANRLQSCEGRLEKALLNLYCLRYENPDLVTVALFRDVHADMMMLAKAYQRAAEARGASIQLGWYDHDARGMLLHRVNDSADYLDNAKGDALGIVMEISGPHVLPLFENEQGSHKFVRGKQEKYCFVCTAQSGMSQFQPPADIHRTGSVTHDHVRRVIDMGQKTVNENWQNRDLRWSRLEELLPGLMEDYLKFAYRGPLQS